MTYVSTVLADSPVGFWEFTEASGTTATDAAGNQNGTYGGTVTLGQTGLAGGGGATAVLFPPAGGDFAVVDAASQRTTDTFTIETWVKRAATGTVQSIFGGGAIGDPQLYFDSTDFIGIKANNVGPGIGLSTRKLTDTSVFHHIVWTKSGSTNHLYLDGLDVTGAIANRTFSTTGHGWGTGSFGTVLFGTCAMFALYTTALTSTRVLAHYASGSAGIPLNIDLPFVTGTGSAIGKVLSCSTGNWTNTPSAYGYQWKRGSTNIGSNAATYATVSADNGQPVTCLVTATGTGGPGIPATSTPSVTPGSFWNPTLQQAAEADTIWLFDADVEATIPPTAGGLIDAWAYNQGDPLLSNPFRSGSGYTVQAGKYLDGITGNTNTSAGHYVYMPGSLIAPDRFTVELWAMSTANWSAGGGIIFQMGGTASISFVATATDVQLQWANSQVYPAVSGTITLSQAFVANQWVNLAAAYDGTTLSFLVNGVVAGTTTGLVPPAAWFGGERTGPIGLLPGFFGPGGTMGPGWEISDIRASRLPRTPGGAVSPVAANTVTITDTVETTLPTDFRGGLHYYANAPANVGNTTIEALNQGYANLARTDKFLSAIPIKSGGVDSTHPTLGHSGSYSYNWGPVDNTLNYMNRLGTRLYLCFDSTPQLLGGGSAPFSAADCANVTKLTAFGSFNSQVPSDFTAFATICADLYHHVTYVRQDTVAYWTFWNEPNGFWAGTDLQMYQLYAAVRSALKAVNPSVVLGGPEGSWSFTETGSFFSYLAANSSHVDVMPVHFYSGDFGALYQWQRTIAAQAAANSLPVPAVTSGETGWNNANNPGSSEPFTAYNFLINSWGAAFYASLLIHAARAGFEAMIFTHLGTSEGTDTGFAGALTSATHPWSIRNLFEMWQKIGG